MKERPILFSAPMVRALLDGGKTQTRRVVKYDIRGPHSPRETFDWHNSKGKWVGAHGGVFTFGKTNAALLCPYGQPGDRLWVREAHSIFPTYGQHRADGERWGPWGGLPTTVSTDGKQIAYYREGFDRCDHGRWRPSIHMPRWASRITLEVTRTRVEKLQDISEFDAQAEGIYTDPASPAYDAYAQLWESINGPGSWDKNPWVWVIEFKRVTAS